jgi:HTH-type transcriptional regulator / antitoxin HigA
MKTATLPKKLPSSFNALVKLMVPHAIRDNVDYDNVAEIVDRLAVMDHRTDGQEEYLETLSQLIEAYDNEHHPIDVSGIKGIKALKLLMDGHEMTASGLGRLLGNRALGSKILRGERELSKTHLRILADKFKVSPALFI